MAAMACVPVLPAFALSQMWLRQRPPRMIRLGPWADPAVRAAVLAGTCALFLVIDGSRAMAALLVAVSGMAGAFGLVGLVAGIGVAIAPDAGLMWMAAGLALAAARPRRWDQAVLSGAGLGLVLFGATAVTAPALSLGCQLLGAAVLLVQVPALLPALLLWLARDHTSDTNALLIAAGTIGAAGCAAMIWRHRTPRRQMPWLFLGYGALAVFAIGLGTPRGGFAALMLALLLTFTQAAFRLSAATPNARMIATAGLIGVSPLGVFPALALLIAETARTAWWLLPLPGLTLIALAWPTIHGLRMADRLAPVRFSAPWIPLAIALAAGWLLPDAAAVWLRGLLGHPS
jgi:hypothetical protein